MKYIIEIEDVPFSKVRIDADNGAQNINLYRAKGFNSLVFDKNGLEKLIPLDNELDEAYQRGLKDGKKQAKAQAELDVCHDIEKVAHGNYQKGLNDAWKCARKLFSEMSDTEINLVFPQEWNNGGFKALMALHPQDAIDRINAFERNQEHDKIKVGDEVMYKSTSGLVDNVVGYFFGDSSDGCYKVLRYVDGKFKTGIWNKENCERTGKHSYAVERMVAVLKEGAECTD